MAEALDVLAGSGPPDVLEEAAADGRLAIGSQQPEPRPLVIERIA